MGASPAGQGATQRQDASYCVESCEVHRIRCGVYGCRSYCLDRTHLPPRRVHISQGMFYETAHYAHMLIGRLQREENVFMDPPALQPERGGPKNLPVLDLGDDDEEQAGLKRKPHLVIVGGGWGVSGACAACLTKLMVNERITGSRCPQYAEPRGLSRHSCLKGDL